MRYVVAIDVGLKNLGLCVYDFNTTQIVKWDNCTIYTGQRYVPSQNVRYVRDFLAQYAEWFDEAQTVLIERQMRANMRIIEAVIQALYFDKTMIVSPKSVKVHYDLSTRNYRLNKQMAVRD